MPSLTNSVNSALKKMQAAGGTGKGVFGEEAVFRVCEEFYQKGGGILYHSFSYATDSSQLGNIKRNEQGKLYTETLGSTTEIDVLLVTPNRIFPIEVKAYKAKEIILDDEGISGCFMTDKSPVHQNEMHCRHLYPGILGAVPNGKTAYIVPIVVFVDKTGVTDRRTMWQQEYIKVTTLSRLADVIIKNDTPLDYLINLDTMAKKLIEIKSSCEKYLPPRKL